MPRHLWTKSLHGSSIHCCFKTQMLHNCMHQSEAAAKMTHTSTTPAIAMIANWSFAFSSSDGFSQLCVHCTKQAGPHRKRTLEPLESCWCEAWWKALCLSQHKTTKLMVAKCIPHKLYMHNLQLHTQITSVHHGLLVYLCHLAAAAALAALPYSSSASLS